MVIIYDAFLDDLYTIFIEGVIWPLLCLLNTYLKLFETMKIILTSLE